MTRIYPGCHGSREKNPKNQGKKQVIGMGKGISKPLKSQQHLSANTDLVKLQGPLDHAGLHWVPESRAAAGCSPVCMSPCGMVRQQRQHPVPSRHPPAPQACREQGWVMGGCRATGRRKRKPGAELPSLSLEWGESPLESFRMLESGRGSLSYV